MRIALIAVALMLAAAGCRQDAPDAVAATASPAAAASAAGTTSATATTTATAAPVPGATDAQAGAAKPAAPAAATSAPETVVADDHAAVNAAIDQALGDHAKYEQAIMAFQSAVAGKHPSDVAALVDYPFAATIDGKPVKIADAATFIARYDGIVTPAIADVVARQKYGDLFVNYKGVMFGNGEAWINGICKDAACKQFDVRVVAIQPTGQ